MKLRKRYLFLVLAFSSAVIAAIVSGIDKIAVEQIDNAWAVSLSCFILALIVAFICGLVLSIPFKNKSLGAKTIDPSFRRIRLIRKQEIGYHLLAGLGNAVLTIGYFALFPMLGNNPSIVLPFSQISILYLVIAESITEKDTPTLIDIQSSIIVTFGAILGSISLSGKISIETFAIVFLVINPGLMIFSFYQRKLKLMKIDERPNDSINIRIWNVVFALLFTIIIIFIYDVFYGTNNISAGVLAAINQFGWMALIAIGTFFSFVLYIRALGIGKASVTQAVKASVIIFSIPVTIVISGIGSFAADPALLLIRIMGIILIMLGISSFALTLTKGYVFIKMNAGYPIEETMKKIWDIKGVTRVCAVAGPYDFIIKIHTRTLLKGYERILRKIESIDGIKDYTTQSVLKEWEDI
jgi:DNA-binding Lrp family transcriptional regulator